MLSQNKIKKNTLGAIIFVVFFVFSFHISYASEISPQNVIKLVNAARAKAGLQSLTENEILTKIANDKAQDMLDDKYFSHTSPSGISPWHWFEKEGYDYKYAGENLAIDFTNAESQQDAWMKSEKHRDNILNVHYNDIGVAVAAGDVEGHMSVFTVQVFGTPAKEGNIARNGENFSAEKITLDSSLQEGNGTVLATKNIKDLNFKIFSDGKELTSDFGKAIQKNQNSILDTSFVLTLAVALLGLVINPLIFVSKSWDEIFRDFKKSWGKRYSKNEASAGFSKSSVEKKNNPNDMDIIKLNKMRI